MSPSLSPEVQESVADLVDASMALGEWQAGNHAQHYLDVLQRFDTARQRLFERIQRTLPRTLSQT